MRHGVTGVAPTACQAPSHLAFEASPVSSALYSESSIAGYFSPCANLSSEIVCSQQACGVAPGSKPRTTPHKFHVINNLGSIFLKTNELTVELCFQCIENKELVPNTPGGEGRGGYPRTGTRPGQVFARGVESLPHAESKELAPDSRESTDPNPSISSPPAAGARTRKNSVLWVESRECYLWCFQIDTSIRRIAFLLAWSYPCRYIP